MEESTAVVRLQALVRAHSVRKKNEHIKKQNKLEKLRKMKQAREERKRQASATYIQAIARGALQRPKFKAAMKRRQEVGGLKEQIKTLKLKLENSEKEKEQAIKEAEDRATRAMAEQDDDTNDDAEAKQMAQQARLHESEKVLQFLESEQLRLQSQLKNHQARCKRMTDNNAEMKEATEAAINRTQEIRNYMEVMYENKNTLNRNKEIYAKNLKAYRKELKTGQEYLKSEEGLRDLYQNAVEQIVALVQEECKDDNLVEDIYIMAMECEGDQDTSLDKKASSYTDATDSTAEVSDSSV